MGYSIAQVDMEEAAAEYRRQKIGHQKKFKPWYELSYPQRHRWRKKYRNNL